MKLFTAVFLSLMLFAGISAAASIDGKWVSERKMERDGQSFPALARWSASHTASVSARVNVHTA